MKKIIAALFLLFCGFIVLLATVDLEPYLAPAHHDTPEKIALPPVPQTDKPPVETEITGQQAQTQETVIPTPEQNIARIEAESDAQKNIAEDSLPVKAEEDPSLEQQQTNTPDAAPAPEPIKAKEAGQPQASPVELEVTILPVNEYPFSILLDTFIERETAQQAILFHKRRGLATHWVKVDLGENGIRYRVFTGVFATEAEAEQYLAQNRLLDKPIKPTYYAARIGIYQDNARLAADFVKAKETGFVPYVLGTQKGDYFLYVGAFYTYIGATDQCRELVAAGLSCQPVKRSTMLPP